MTVDFVSNERGEFEAVNDAILWDAESWFAVKVKVACVDGAILRADVDAPVFDAAII